MVGSVDSRGFSVNCKACNTRVPTGLAHCPHCGREMSPGRHAPSVEPDPMSTSASSRSPLAPSMIPSPEAEPKKKRSGGSKVKAVPLEEDLEMSTTMTNQKVRGRATKKARAAPRVRKEEVPPSEEESVSLVSSASLSMPVDPSQIRHLISERPELLEPELCVFVDVESQHRGVGFETEVGEIDLLARSSSGDLVVVMVADVDSADESIAGMLQRVGWVRKHLCAQEQRARGILLVDRIDEASRYTAAALSDSVSFLTWRLSLQFESLLG